MVAIYNQDHIPDEAYAEDLGYDPENAEALDIVIHETAVDEYNQQYFDNAGRQQLFTNINANTTDQGKELDEPANNSVGFKEWEDILADYPTHVVPAITNPTSQKDQAAETFVSLNESQSKEVVDVDDVEHNREEKSSFAKAQNQPELDKTPNILENAYYPKTALKTTKIGELLEHQRSKIAFISKEGYTLDKNKAEYNAKGEPLTAEVKYVKFKKLNQREQEDFGIGLPDFDESHLGKQICYVHIGSKEVGNIGYSSRIQHIYHAIDLDGMSETKVKELADHYQQADRVRRLSSGEFEKRMFNKDGSLNIKNLDLTSFLRLMTDEEHWHFTPSPTKEDSDRFNAVLKDITRNSPTHGQNARELIGQIGKGLEKKEYELKGYGEQQPPYSRYDGVANRVITLGLGQDRGSVLAKKLVDNPDMVIKGNIHQYDNPNDKQSTKTQSSGMDFSHDRNKTFAKATHELPHQARTHFESSNGPLNLNGAGVKNINEDEKDKDQENKQDFQNQYAAPVGLADNLTHLGKSLAKDALDLFTGRNQPQAPVMAGGYGGYGSRGFGGVNLGLSNKIASAFVLTASAGALAAGLTAKAAGAAWNSQTGKDVRGTVIGVAGEMKNGVVEWYKAHRTTAGTDGMFSPTNLFADGSNQISNALVVRQDCIPVKHSLRTAEHGKLNSSFGNHISADIANELLKDRKIAMKEVNGLTSDTDRQHALRAMDKAYIEKLEAKTGKKLTPEMQQKTLDSLHALDQKGDLMFSRESRAEHHKALDVMFEEQQASATATLDKQADAAKNRTERTKDSKAAVHNAKSETEAMSDTADSIPKEEEQKKMQEKLKQMIESIMNMLKGLGKLLSRDKEP